MITGRTLLAAASTGARLIGLEIPLVSRFTPQETSANTPITDMLISSLITSHIGGSQARFGSSRRKCAAK